MKYLYLLINLFSICIPLILSFDKKVQFYKKWKSIFLSILIVGTGFILWDIYFETKGYWGFNKQYLTGIYIFNLPLEEWLFFFTIPYACLFIYETIKAYFIRFIERFPSQQFMKLFFLSIIVLLVFNFEKPYTIVAVSLAIFILVYLQIKKPKYLSLLLVSYLVTIIPFLAVNGILTGSFIENEVVWYNPQAFSSIRLFTIPIEDLIYCFDLLALNIILMEAFIPKHNE